MQKDLRQSCVIKHWSKVNCWGLPCSIKSSGEISEQWQLNNPLISHLTEFIYRHNVIPIILNETEKKGRVNSINYIFLLMKDYKIMISLRENADVPIFVSFWISYHQFFMHASTLNDAEKSTWSQIKWETQSKPKDFHTFALRISTFTVDYGFLWRT